MAKTPEYALQSEVDTKTTDVSWVSYTPTTQGFGTITNADFYYKVIGDSILIKGTFTTGTTSATEAQIALPAGYTIKAGLSLGSLGMWDRGVSTATDIRIFATGGDAFLNLAQDNSSFAAQDGNVLGSTEDQAFWTTLIPVE